MIDAIACFAAGVAAVSIYQRLSGHARTARLRHRVEYERERRLEAEAESDAAHAELDGYRASCHVPADQLLAMRMALRVAAVTFRDYEGVHRAKGTPEGEAKAARNREMAEIVEEALGPDLPA